MIYVVDKYLDQIREKESVTQANVYEYFDSLDAAHTFLRNRATALVAKAERNLRAAYSRERKCYKKFPEIRLGESK